MLCIQWVIKEGVCTHIHTSSLFSRISWILPQLSAKPSYSDFPSIKTSNKPPSFSQFGTSNSLQCRQFPKRLLHDLLPASHRLCTELCFCFMTLNHLGHRMLRSTGDAHALHPGCLPPNMTPWDLALQLLLQVVNVQSLVKSVSV